MDLALRGGLGDFRAPQGEWRDAYRTETLLLAERG